MTNNQLDSVSKKVKQKIYECISQAICEDRKEANAVLDLRTHVSDPFLNWDLIYRNLMNSFPMDNIVYSSKKQGMWEVLLLCEENNGILISFMKNTRFKSIKNSKSRNQPKYIQALLTLNSDLQAKEKQESFFEINENEKVSELLKKNLNEMCLGFGKGSDEFKRHILVVFSNDYGNLSSLDAYILDRDFDIVYEQNWLNDTKLIMTTLIEGNEKSNTQNNHLVLKRKSYERINNKELVTLKEKAEKEKA